MKRYKQAIKDFDAAKVRETKERELNPNLAVNAGISDGLGRCYHALGEYDDAKTKFDDAIDNKSITNKEKRNFLLHKA